jgi:hypothetical protein
MSTVTRRLMNERFPDMRLATCCANRKTSRCQHRPGVRRMKSSSSARSAESLNGFFMAQLPSSSCIPYEACRAAGRGHRLVNLLIRLPEPQQNLRKYNYHIGGFAAPPGARAAF